MDSEAKGQQKMEVDEESLRNATQAVQAVERLSLCMQRLSASTQDLKVKENVQEALTNLRRVKASLEGSDENFIPLAVNEGPLLELKQLLLMQVPSSVTSAVQQRFSNLIDQALEGHCKKIIGAVMLTCPWYEATQKERGEQAKHNVLLIIVMFHDHQFFSPINPQVQEAGSVVDLGWLSVIEMSHFGRFLAKGRTRYVEALFCPKPALVYASEEWHCLQSQLKASQITGLCGFLEACCGQAMGSITKKRKNGSLKLRENATVAEICESFRLLHHVYNHSVGQGPATSALESDTLPEAAQQALLKLQALYQDPDVSKQDIFSCLMTWHSELRTQLQGMKLASPSGRDMATVVGRWMMKTRLQGRMLTPLSGPEDSHSKLTQLMSEVGGPIAKLLPHQILLAARAGSFMYNLSTPDSDVDYVVVYRDNTETVLSACRRPLECLESRGPSKQVEYGAYEVRLLAEMLLKGSVVILELVYLDEHHYVSPLWQMLSNKKRKFVTELAMQQYLGLIKNNFHMLHGGKHTGTSRERKLFYQIFHKIDSVRHMMKGDVPPVYVTGSVRDFIMRVRTEELKDDLSRESLLKTATEQYEDLRQAMASRQVRLRENPDFGFVTEWLLQVRGIS